MTRNAGLLVLTALSLIAPARPAAQSAASPKLVVILVVDQMRADYFTSYAPQYESGLKRFRDEGAVFERGFYPYVSTVTCAGHATIGTGSVPATHGVILNEWWHRDKQRRVPCTVDDKHTSLLLSGRAERGHSAYQLKAPTLADTLRAASPQSRVVSMSLKARSAIMMAGHGGDLVTWFADANEWATSTAFSQEIPQPLRSFTAQHPVARERDLVWERLKPLTAYRGPDAGTGERPPRGREAAFPHPMMGARNAAPDQFPNLWERSPLSDAYVGRMAAAMVEAYELGQRDAVDFLGVSFSALDYVGHDFGPDSHEVQDTLFRIDRTIGALFDALDKSVGPGRYVVGLSADHGVAPIAEAMVQRGIDAGRVRNAEVREIAEAAMVAAHGPGPHVAHVEFTDLYLTDKTRALVAAHPRALQPLLDAVGRIKGVRRVLPTPPLTGKRNSRDPLERAAALGYYPGASGDVYVVLKPFWSAMDTTAPAATHGSFNDYDRHVPVMFYGSGIKPGRYRDAASPADLAPTLAAIIKIDLPKTDGKVLKSALKSR